MQTEEKKYQNTDVRLNQVPNNPKDYGLCFFPAPNGFDIESHRQRFAQDAFNKKMVIGAAQDLWYEQGKKLLGTFEEGQKKGQAEEYQKRYLVTPMQAHERLTEIFNDPKHPYNDELAPLDLHELAVSHVERYLQIRNSNESDFVDDVLIKHRAENTKDYIPGVRNSSNGIETADLYGTRHNSPTTIENVGFGTKETSSGYGSKISDQ